MNRKQIEEEFWRLLNILVSQGDLDVIDGMIPFNTKKSFVENWEEDE